MSEPALKIVIVPVTPFQQNCSLIICQTTTRAAIVDPGGDVPAILEALKQTGAVPEKILITHGHLDHVGGVAELSRILSIPVEGPHEADSPLMASVEQQAVRFGATGMHNAETGRWLKEGDTVSVGVAEFDVRHIPGHSPGHVVFVNGSARLAIVGDTLFQGSVGRTDLPGGNHGQLIDGIKRKLLTLPDDFMIVPGHGQPSSIGEERAQNPFLSE